MEIQISPTKRLVRVRPEWLPVARLWEGQTRDGMHIAAFLLRIYVVPSRRLQPEEIPESQRFLEQISYRDPSRAVLDGVGVELLL